MLWAVPPSFTPCVLSTYNERFTLPDVASNARAAVIGRVTKEKRYKLLAAGAAVCDVPIDVLTGSIAVERVAAPAVPTFSSTIALDQSARLPAEAQRSVEDLLAAVLSHPDVCSRRPLIEHYDCAVRGATVIPPGYADAGVILVKRGARAGIALSVDGNPRYGVISPRAAAAHAVVESARNVAAVGAQPIGLTDCLNYGNPEDPVAYRQLCDGVEGLAEAANALTLNERDEALPFVSGNVSLYNESASGRAIAPSAIVACVGRVDDVARIATMRLTGGDRRLLLFGARRLQLGGSVLAAVLGAQPQDLPPIDYADANASIRALVEGIRTGAVTAAHDISDGGLLACVAEMCLGGDADGTIGARLTSPLVWAPDVPAVAALFGETGGFVVEVPTEKLGAFEAICTAAGASPIAIGVSGGATLRVSGICDVPLSRLAQAWTAPLREVYA